MEPLDILYTPLDVPPPPKIDFNKLYQWIKDNHTKQYIDIRPDASLKVPNKIYPWNIIYPRYKNVWCLNFNKKFPELANYFSVFGDVKTIPFGTIAILPVKTEFDGIGFWHSDPDDYGLRLYLENNDTVNSLGLAPTVLPYNERNTELSQIGKKLHDTKVTHPLLQKQQIYVTTTNRHAFFINNIRAFHTVKTNIKGSSRMAIIIGSVQPMRTMPLQIKQLIINSALKYKDEAVLWTPEQS